MNLSKNISKKALVSMFPALDVIDDTLIVAVKVLDSDDEVVTAYITSDKRIMDRVELVQYAKENGLDLKVKELDLDGDARLDMATIQAFLDNELDTPEWSDVYNRMYAEFDGRLEVPDQRYITVLVLFSMMTYFHPLFNFLPILHALGMPGSGKSRAGELVALTAFNGRINGSITGSAMFRTAHEGRYTYVIDEADHYAELGSGDRFMQQLQSGYKKASASVTLTENIDNGKRKPETFMTFTPKMVCSTKPFKSFPLRDRSIRLNIIRKPDASDAKLRKVADSDTDVWTSLRADLYTLQLQAWQEVKAMQDRLSKTWVGPKGRVFDNWLPLATIAALVGEDVLKVVTSLANDAMDEQKRDTGTQFEAVPLQFARWLVRDGDKEYTESQLYALFTQAGSTDKPDHMTVPVWASQLGKTTTLDFIKKAIHDKKVLVFQLQRLGLLPMQKEKQRTNKGNPYKLTKTKIDAIVNEYLGKAEEIDEDCKTPDELLADVA